MKPGRRSWWILIPLLVTLVIGAVMLLILARKSAPSDPGEPLIAHAAPAVLNPGQQAQWPLEICNQASVPHPLQLRLGSTESATLGATPATIQSETCLSVMVAVTAPAEPRWVSVPVFNRATQIGELGLSTRDVGTDGVAVTLATGAELVSVGGKAAPIIVTTDDKATKPLPLAWKLEAGPWYAAGVSEFVRGSRILRIPVRGQNSWKRWVWQFWPVTKQGTLTFTLGQRTVGTTREERVFQLPVRLAFQDQTAQSTLTTFLVFIPLLLGGTAAYFFNTVVPLQRRRHKLSNKLQDLKQQLKKLRSEDHSRSDVASLLYQDARRTLETLDAFVFGSPELNAELEQLEAKAESLKLRVTALRRVLSLPTMPGRGLGLFALDAMRTSAAKVVNELRSSREESAPLLAALKNLDIVEEMARAAGQEQATIATTIATECNKLKQLVNGLGDDAGWKTIAGKLKEELRLVGLGEVRPGEHHKREFSYWRTRIAFDLHRAGESPDNVIKTLASISDGNWEPIDNARVFSVSETRVKEALQSNSVKCRIIADRSPVHARELVHFTLWFDDDRMNYSRVREKWRCVWSFEGKQFRGGWTAWRYFKTVNPDGLDVAVVGFQDEASQEIKLPKEITTKVAVLETRTQMLSQPWVSTIGSLFLVQVIPLFALLSSNTDVLKTRDPLSAVLILIAAGFGVDTAKSLLATAATAVTKTVSQQVTRDKPTKEITEGADENSELVASLKQR